MDLVPSRSRRVKAASISRSGPLQAQRPALASVCSCMGIPESGLAEIAITLTVNGQKKRLSVAPWTTLLDLLRDGLHCTGVKKGCDHGQCGACTVLVDGKRINSCLTFAVMKDGAEITTIEGLADGPELHPLQAAFIEHDALQCGYCTPGQICSAVGLLQEGDAETEDDIRELMSGNICRCGAYPNIVKAVASVLNRKNLARAAE